MLHDSEIQTLLKLTIRCAFTPGTFCFALFETDHLFRISSYVPLGSLCFMLSLHDFKWAKAHNLAELSLCSDIHWHMRAALHCRESGAGEMPQRHLGRHHSQKQCWSLNLLDLFVTLTHEKKRLS